MTPVLTGQPKFVPHRVGRADFGGAMPDCRPPDRSGEPPEALADRERWFQTRFSHMRLMIPLTLAGAVAMAAVGGWAWQRRDAGPSPTASAGGPGQGQAMPPLAVDVYQVVAEPFEVTVPATGTLLARESVELVSELSRRLVRIRAEEGAKVKRGDVLFELDRADLQAELKRLDVQIELARVNVERQTALLAEGLTTRQQFDTTEAELAGANAQRGMLAVTLSKTLLRAPFAGTMGLRHVSEGAWLSSNTVLATLHDTSTLKLDFTLPERYSEFVAKDREFRFRVAGHDAPLQGKVLAFEPAVDAQTRSVLVRGIIENSANLLPGAFASVELPIRVEQALLLPAIAVIPGVEGRRVFVVREGVAHGVGVELGARTESRVQVLSGVAAGDQVIVTNLLRVRDGARVAVRKTAPAAPASSAPATTSSQAPAASSTAAPARTSSAAPERGR